MGMSHYITEDLGGIATSVAAIEPQDASAGTVNGTAHALRTNRPLSCILFGHVGQASGSPTAQSVTFKLQDAADDGAGAVDAGTWADFTGGGGTAITTDSAGDEIDVDLKGARDYVRAVATVAFTDGTTPAIELAAVITFAGYHKDQ